MRLLWLTVMGVLILCACVLSAGAVVQEVTVEGTVASVTQATNSIAIQNPSQYGCTYPASGEPVCTWTPMNVSTLTGTVPDTSAYSVFSPGDTAIATSLGGAGGTWISLAKLYGPLPTQGYVTNIVGDVQNVPDPLIGNYSLNVTTVPDCSRCSGTLCNATSADVQILSDGAVVSEKTLMQGQSLTFNGRNDGSSITATFINGEALSSSCPNVAPGMVGMQPVSVYNVQIVPPTGYSQVNIGTTAPPTALPTTTVTAASTPAASMPVTVTTAATPIPTTKSGGLPFAVIGAIGVLIMILSKRQKS